jgi:dipeptidyl-peptidase 4
VQLGGLSAALQAVYLVVVGDAGALLMATVGRVLVLATLLAVGVVQAETRLTTADYARAEQFMPYNTEPLVFGAVDTVTWLPSGRFWYSTRTHAGTTLCLVDPVRGSRRTVFEQSKLTSLSPGIGGQDDGSRTDLDNFEISDDERTVRFQAGTSRWQCNANGSTCQRIEQRRSGFVSSPDGKWEAFVRDYNLWLRDRASGKETQLTADGVPDFGYAVDNSARRYATRPPSVLWSPDSRRIATFQLDERGVGEMYSIAIARGHPDLVAWKYPLAGDVVLPQVHRVIIDVAARKILRLKMPQDAVRSASWSGLAHPVSGKLEAQWSADGVHLAFISVSRDYRHVWLRLADAATGDVREVLEERSPAFYEAALSFWHTLRADSTPNWRYLSATGEIIWYSSRDKWSHLYLYDLATGQLKTRITSGAWNVVTLLHVDERRRLLYFLAVGREPGRNPYFEHLYRVRMDGSNMTSLTPENFAHNVSMSPSADYFVDMQSRADVGPVTLLKDSNGRVVRKLEEADISQLAALGWRPPVTITTKARDGTTDLYGLMFKPSSLDESRRYPIINAIYSSPLLGSVRPNARSAQWGAFATTYGALADAHSLAELGFIVVMIDGLGTPLRSTTFHEFTYGKYGDASIPDQVAGMRELARRFSWIDIGRAGIYGASGGGYSAARAMFTNPEVFKVGTAISGNHDLRSYSDNYVEKFMGPLVQGSTGGSNYDHESNMDLAKNLQGRLLLVHGMMDDNVLPQHTLLLADALIDANKDFDLLMLPRQVHRIADGGAVGRYVVRRNWDHFVRYLMGAEPPAEYRMCTPAEMLQLGEQCSGRAQLMTRKTAATLH